MEMGNQDEHSKEQEEKKEQNTSTNNQERKESKEISQKNSKDTENIAFINSLENEEDDDSSEEENKEIMNPSNPDEKEKVDQCEGSKTKDVPVDIAQKEIGFIAEFINELSTSKYYAKTIVAFILLVLGLAFINIKEISSLKAEIQTLKDTIILNNQNNQIMPSKSSFNLSMNIVKGQASYWNLN